MVSLVWEQVAVDSADPRGMANWWSEALGWPILDDEDEGDDEEVEIGIPGQPSLLFIRVPEVKSVKNRLHLDFRPRDRDAEVERLVGMGAQKVDVGQGDEVTWVVLADPEGNEFCILRSRAEQSAAGARLEDSGLNI